ncbi:hypothetical protein ACWT_7354 [Actinoplanes sp. SE50]|uniref:hypothetical protein n=1 Tax=unclassified Actinoplanes TaxID=2626549 RepID=UPI00023EDFE3|nr:MULTISPECIES: hypothetical protein [unclassified Actinoplanes]AEV88364.1 hypothetical protein ACPL_7484 [Actinoplanes sp. SE50/110]ATO86769.1 hypothetical protein ACWT_7354 [Actinoplanes sp. SE50]SLM04187.1 uncharacterized protein ACSP50_7490 [Actinoplanes sp. SE50/110]
MTDQRTEAYNALARDDFSPLRRVMDDVEKHPSLSNWTGSYLPRPLFADRRQLDAFAADVLTLFDVITSLPDRLFDGDLDRYTAALGVEPRRAKLIRSLGGITPPRYGRADMYHDGTSFKLLEIGIASEVGGADRAGEIPRALLENEAFAGFAAEHGLDYVHTGERVARTLRAAGASIGAAEPVVVLLEAPGGLANYASHWNTFRDVQRRAGLDFHVAEIGDITDRDGKLHLGDVAVDVILRCFTVEELIAEPDGEALVEPILRAHRAGSVVLFTPLESNLFANKGALALLSDPRRRAAFTAAEQAVIDRVLPWTRSLTDADELGLIDLGRERRETLILKPNGYYGGVGVIAGWETPEADWERALREGVADGAIIQERVVPRSEPVVDPGTGEVQPWQAAWGLFYTPEGFAGAYGRAVPAFESAVIGVTAYKNTRTAGVFHY